MPGNEISYKLIDTDIDPKEVVNYPVEFLNSLDFPGIPPHKLQLKIGSIIIHALKFECTKAMQWYAIGHKKL